MFKNMEEEYLKEKNELIESGYRIEDYEDRVCWLVRVLKTFQTDNDEDTTYTLSARVVLSKLDKKNLRKYVSLDVKKNNKEEIASLSLPNSATAAEAESLADTFQKFVLHTFLDGHKIKEEKINRDNWIRVKDKFPGSGSTVMTYGTGVYSRGMCTYDDTEKSWNMFGQKIDGVTHWHRFPGDPDKDF